MVSPPSSKLAELALEVQQLTSKIITNLSANQIAEPDFSVDSNSIPETPENVRLRASLNDAVLDLLRLVNGPRNDVRDLICTLYDIVAWQVACEFGFFEVVPEDGVATINEIAAKAGLDEDRVGRMMRILATDRIFEEVKKDEFRHTSRSIVFKHDKQIRDAVHYHRVDEYFKAASETLASIKQSPSAFDASNCPFVTRHGAPLFQYYQTQPQLAARFASAMAGIGRMERQFEELRDSYAWSDIPRGRKVVDIGGGNGHMAIALARKFPNLEITVQDSVEMLIQASKQDLSDLEGRVAFMQHNFFDPQPITSAYAYLLRQVTHNWSDQDCIRIFRALAPALEKSGKGTPLLINEIVLPALKTSSLYQERRLRQVDIMMMVALGARQRTEEQFRVLLEAADTRFKVSNALFRFMCLRPTKATN
ncbi:O-methyltransferas-like protein [Lojkania enalia]|uniref:O-methyltransferas-like protein n=1 Tax=Lojkania enalia TaxID=147567 RepID=A0A9P4N8V3_9PLEO|nr:O-methyltransferas-like protein [Didymosphaeria enalia]